mgnify:CR=1 FL=1
MHSHYLIEIERRSLFMDSPIVVRQGDQDSGEIEHCVKKIIKALGEDPDREGLVKTPKRVADSFVFLTSGYTTNLQGL